MLFAGHSGTGSCPVFGVGKFRSLKNRSWRTALHAHRKENVFGKLIFNFQGSERENGMAVFCGTAIRIIGAAILPKKFPSLYTTFFGDFLSCQIHCLQIVFIFLNPLCMLFQTTEIVHPSDWEIST